MFDTPSLLEVGVSDRLNIWQVPSGTHADD